MRILVPRPEIEPIPTVLEAWSLNHWTTREVPKQKVLKQCLLLFWGEEGKREKHLKEHQGKLVGEISRDYPDGASGKKQNKKTQRACQCRRPKRRGTIPSGEDLLEEHMATHSRIFAWRIPWTEEPGRLQSIGSQRVGHDGATLLSDSKLEFTLPNKKRNKKHPTSQRSTLNIHQKD